MIGKELEEFIKDETKAFEERLRAKAEELREQMVDKPKTIWDLDIKDGEEYYNIASDGEIRQFGFNDTYDEDNRDMGNAFLTEEEAEFERERRRIETILRKYSRPFEYEEENYYICYDYVYDSIEVRTNYTIVDGNPYFESEEIAQKVIDEIGEVRLLKYWFGVKDE